MNSPLPYFRTPERIRALLAEIQKSVGTRWAHAGTRTNRMECGLTDDCLFWVKAFRTIGALPAHIEIPPYRRMEASADRMCLLRLRIMETGRAELVYEADFAKRFPIFRVGDVLLFKNGMSGVHCGLVVRQSPLHFFHLGQNGAMEEPFHQGQWIAAIAYAYRLLEEDGRATVPVAAVPAMTTAQAVHP
jgi:hypothetical protein